jgi:Flp pilus assembly protein TadG
MGSRGNFDKRRRQGGATALEFAFVLPIMFLLFYGALTYGLIFLMRMSLQHAAEDGARAALRWPEQSCEDALGRLCTAQEQTQHQYAARLLAAYTVTLDQTQWMNLRVGPSALAITSRICRVGLDCAGDVGGETVVSCAAPDCAPGAPPDCGSDFTSSCQVVVTVTYDYAGSPLVPPALGLGLVTPAVLGAQARLLLDGRALAS